MVNQLNDTKAFMEDHRRAMHEARSDAIFRRGDVVDVVSGIFKAGFKYLKTHMTVPGPLNFRQAVTRWVIERQAR